MALRVPWESPRLPDDAPEDDPKAPAPAPAPARAREGGDGGELLAFPGSDVAQGDDAGGLVRVRAAGGTWLSEASQTAGAALDGSVFRSRPPALRDMHARVSRAEWAGDIGALRIAGQALGWVGLVLNTVLYGAAWATRRPVRLLVTVALIAAVVVKWGWPL